MTLLLIVIAFVMPAAVVVAIVVTAKRGRDRNAEQADRERRAFERRELERKYPPPAPSSSRAPVRRSSSEPARIPDEPPTGFLDDILDPLSPSNLLASGLLGGIDTDTSPSIDSGVDSGAGDSGGGFDGGGGGDFSGGGSSGEF